MDVIDGSFQTHHYQQREILNPAVFRDDKLRYSHGLKCPFVCCVLDYLVNLNYISM